MAELGTNGSGLNGALAEFRVWDSQRTAQQIREDMVHRLSGNEPGLVGLWSFADPANPGRDASPRGHDGKLVGKASVTQARLPMVVCGQITGAAGPGAQRSHRPSPSGGGRGPAYPGQFRGEYAFTLPPFERCDLFVTDGRRSAYRLGYQPDPGPRQRLDSTLAETPGGTETAATVSRGGDGSFPNPPVNVTQAPETSRLRPEVNRVLRLTGTHSAVELPPEVLKGVTELTIESWVKWEEVGQWRTVFSFGAGDGLNWGVFGGRWQRNCGGYLAAHDGRLRTVSRGRHLFAVLVPRGDRLDH